MKQNKNISKAKVNIHKFRHKMINRKILYRKYVERIKINLYKIKIKQIYNKTIKTFKI